MPTGWATVSQLEKDFNITFSSLDRVDNDMVQSQLDKGKGIILGIIGKQYSSEDVDEAINAIHLNVSGELLMRQLNRLGIRGYEAAPSLLDDDDYVVLESYISKDEQDEPISLDFNDNSEEINPYGSFWYK